MDGRAGVVRSDDHLDLAEDFVSSCLISANNVEGSGSLSVESHCLGEGLRDDHLEALLEEIFHRVSVFLEISRGETLIGRVEEGEEVIFLHDLSDSVPLLWGWVCTSRVVSASMEEDDGTWLGVVEVLNHAFKVESLSSGVVVSVFSDFDSSSGKDCVVVSPGGLAHIDGGVSPLLEEISNDLETSSSTESLAGDDSSSGVDWVVESEASLS